MKRFLLFGGMNYYPSGGWGDFLGDFESLEAAQARERMTGRPSYPGDWWWHVVDTATEAIVDEGHDPQWTTGR